MEPRLCTAWLLEADLLSKFPAFWWSLKHAHTDTTVTPNSRTLTPTHTLSVSAGVFRHYLQTLSSSVITTQQRHVDHRCLLQFNEL